MITDAIDKVADKISDLLQKRIEKDVFTTANEWYERTGQFENAFVWTGVKKNGSRISNELFYDYARVKWNQQWEHGHPKWGSLSPKSSAENLADILNLAFNDYNDGYTSGLMFGDRHFSHYRRPYWKNFINDLFSGGKLDKMLRAELKAAGLNIT